MSGLDPSVVQFPGIRWALPCQSEVCGSCTMYMHYLFACLTAAGVLPSQYKRMSSFARMGKIGKNYINKGYCIDISFASIACVVC